MTHLYSISLVTGASSSEVLTRNYSIGPILLDGGVLVAHWSGTDELVDRLDPTTAEISPLGNLGTLMMWSNQYVLDSTRGIVYAAGMDSGNVKHLYRLSL